ncbi:hypothetical protein [Pseudoflavitalea rhizosphaerae]|uniref:hypothetical protein n=1 Tax=Pseudoflavitalea rhizosphaerae TaxID=1884793 RepID=UPI000F8E7EC6|nr:hypothetical protein [Pseudoflavitalea rhizosphaerae]
MYDFKSNLVLGFHGCEAAVRDELLMYPDRVKISKQPFDWLGHGLYFWENNYERAWQWALSKQARNTIREPAVLGAVLQLGYCCDFLESQYIDLLSKYHKGMVNYYLSSGTPLPVNKDAKGDLHKDKLLRYLDCAAIEFMHDNLKSQNPDTTSVALPGFPVFDSVRGAFVEGGPAFEGSGIFSKTHIQICIRNLNCIRGFFKPQKRGNQKDCFLSNQPD